MRGLVHIYSPAMEQEVAVVVVAVVVIVVVVGLLWLLRCPLVVEG